MANSLKNFVKYLLPSYQKIILEYKIDPKPRYGYGLKPHEKLNEIINKNRSLYTLLLEEIMLRKDTFQAIKSSENEKDENQPAWNNNFLPGLDIIALYILLCHFKPKKYIEIGSGNSTKVARKAIKENKLGTIITSVDPFPRANIDHLADKVVRQPIERITDYTFITDELNENDILFIDGSHNCLPNSDGTVCFLDILPYLKKGVVVHVHDIYLPYDYPQFMCDRYYSEQYVLAAFILANPEKYSPVFPGFFISEDKELSSKIEAIWEHPNTSNVEKHGGSFWFQVK
jgi:hypothetical protein